MNFIKRKKAFIELGNRLKKLETETYSEIVREANLRNPWFTPENIELSFDGLTTYLNEVKFSTWLENYSFEDRASKNIGVVMAGNIPMVGIHDFICTLISGHKLVAKLSSIDETIIRFIASELISIEAEFANKIEFVDKLKNIDAAITTGSDNSARYFNYYFGKYPNIIRKNRTSVAVLTGNESPQDLQNLSHDIYSYFGLGCRNVSKLFLPDRLSMSQTISHFESYQGLENHSKYHNNYFYNKSILLVNQTEHLDNGFSLFKKDEKLVSPISVVYYEYYDDMDHLKTKLADIDDKIQCVVSSSNDFENSVPFGKAQKPEVWDYADNVDTLKFLLSI